MPINAIIIVVGLLSCAAANPVPSKKVKDEYADAKVVYDQRQEGEWNVRAHLDNFVIMIIPAAQTASSASPSPSLLDLLTKSAPKRAKHAPTPDAALETMHFIESKTAPYRVDLTEDDVAVGASPRSVAPSGGKSKRVAGKKGKGAPGGELVLLGAENEQCGPGMARDSYGMCRVYKKY